MASKRIEIKLTNTKTIPFVLDNFDSLPSNNALKNIEIYYAVDSTNPTPILIGKSTELNALTHIENTESVYVNVYLMFKFINTPNTTENNNKIYASSNFKWRLWESTTNLQSLSGFFCLMAGDNATTPSTKATTGDMLLYGDTVDITINKCSQPIATPSSSSVSSGTNVILSTITENANIYYTLDGSTPDSNSIIYTSPITITENTTIKAIAIKEVLDDSDILTSVYTIAIPTTKSIEVTIRNTLYNQVKSDIEFFYSIADNPNAITNPIVSLGSLTDLHSNILHIEYTSENMGVFILYKYNTDDTETNSNNSDNFLKMGISDNNKSFGVYDDNLDKFIFKKNSLYKVFNESNTKLEIYELIYSLQILPIIENHFTVTPKKITYSLTPETITLQADTGYFFSNPPTLTLKNPMGSTVKKFTLSANSKTATLTINTTDLNNKFISNTNIQIERETVISDKYGLVTLYKPTNEQLKQLSTKLLYKYNLDSGKYDLLDLSKYILSFISLPLDVEEFDSKEMTLNSISTGITIDYIDDNIILLDFGEIYITGFYNNSIDYKNTKITLYLPFVDNVTLDTSKYMNKTITLSYRVDLFTGDFIAIIRVNNIIYDSFSGNCSIQIPFINKVSRSDISIKDYSNNNLLDDNTPKVIVTSNVKNDNVIINTNYYTQLNNLSGYNVIDNFEESVSSHLNKNDIEHITDLLRQGVIF